MRLAIVADWLTVFAGAERTISALLGIFPDAALFTTVTRRETLGPLAKKTITTTPLQRWYAHLGRHQPLLPWMPRAIEDIDLRGFDVVISSSHAIAKGVIPQPGTFHICYCHTPMRYAWEMEQQYLDDFGVPPFLRKTVRRMLRDLRRWDLSTAKRVDFFIANSHETQERIGRIYGRESVVLHPPVAEHFLKSPLNTAKREGFMTVGRLVPYKRVDLLIKLANQRQLPLTIIGKGQEEKRLKAMAGPTVKFLGFVPEEELASHYAKAEVLLFPAFEDAGIVPLEAQACGTPVIALSKGGALDSVVDGKTGLFFHEQSAASIGEAVDRFRVMNFDPKEIRQHAEQFSEKRFQDQFLAYLKVNCRHAPRSRFT